MLAWSPTLVWPCHSQVDPSQGHVTVTPPPPYHRPHLQLWQINVNIGSLGGIITSPLDGAENFVSRANLMASTAGYFQAPAHTITRPLGRAGGAQDCSAAPTACKLYLTVFLAPSRSLNVNKVVLYRSAWRPTPSWYCGQASVAGHHS